MSSFDHLCNFYASSTSDFGVVCPNTCKPALLSAYHEWAWLHDSVDVSVNLLNCCSGRMNETYFITLIIPQSQMPNGETL